DRRLDVDRRRARDDVDAGGDHGDGVDEGRHRGGSLHGVGQPHGQPDLGGLAGGADEEQQPDGGGGPDGQLGGGPAQHALEREGPERGEHHHQPDQKAQVADPVDDGRLLGGGGGAGTGEPEPDQQVREIGRAHV